ncbi:MAG: AAA family ATPase [Deltaproteobacteria bacterium]|nr:AAA family ATPase [Deltaproteobacteria bacterium]
MGNRDFADIIDYDFLYDDKSRYIIDLINGPSNSYFLSRPRRFGKTAKIRTFGFRRIR